MTRYIDADETTKTIIKRLGIGSERYLLPAERAIVDVIESMPTIDAEPVKHGKWIDMGDHEQCSACNSTHLKEFQSYYGKVTWVKTPYCPQCGAKMDEERKEK